VTSRVLSQIVITRFITDEGDDLVQVDSDNMEGEDISVIEALGLLALAEYDLMHRPVESSSQEE
jgi:hypothetical protein